MSDPGYPCNRHFVRVFEGEPVGVPVGPETRYQLSADLIERAWSPRTRGVLIASPSNPDRHAGPARRACAGSRTTVARLGGRLIVDEIYLGLTYEERAAVGAVDRRAARRRPLRRVELLQVLQHDGLAAGLGDRAGAARPRPREARAEPLHLAADGVAARGARVLPAGDARDRSKSDGARFAIDAISSSRRCASWASGFR